MTDAVKIVTFEIENVKRVSAVTLSPTQDGLTIIGGDNRQGKSTCLHAIAAACGGAAFDPSDALKDGAEKGKTLLTLSNGFTVKKAYTENGAYLTVTDPRGEKAGQSLLNEFISTFALDLSGFLNANEKAKADILLKTIGVDLSPFTAKHADLYGKREAVGQLKKRAAGHFESMPYNEGVPTLPVTPTEMIARLQAAISQNEKNAQARANAAKIAQSVIAAKASEKTQSERIEETKNQIAILNKRLEALQLDAYEMAETIARAEKDAEYAAGAAASLTDANTDSIKAELAEIDKRNALIRQNLDRQKAEAEAEEHAGEYKALTAQIERNRADMTSLLDAASWPIPELTIVDTALHYKGKAWDCMSHSAQLIIATAIAHATNPKMGFVLIDQLESMDLATLADYGAWLVSRKLQAIGTRVSKGAECTIVIHDGMIQAKANEFA